MRSVGVVVDPPCFDDLADLGKVREQGFVEALVAELAVEALDEAILHRFARRDVVPFDVTLLLPGQDGVRRELGAIVANCGFRLKPARYFDGKPAIVPN